MHKFPNLRVLKFGRQVPKTPSGREISSLEWTFPTLYSACAPDRSHVDNFLVNLFNLNANVKSEKECPLYCTRVEEVHFNGMLFDVNFLKSLVECFLFRDGLASRYGHKWALSRCSITFSGCTCLIRDEEGRWLTPIPIPEVAALPARKLAKFQQGFLDSQRET